MKAPFFGTIPHCLRPEMVPAPSCGPGACPQTPATPKPGWKVGTTNSNGAEAGWGWGSSSSSSVISYQLSLSWLLLLLWSLLIFIVVIDDSHQQHQHHQHHSSCSELHIWGMETQPWLGFVSARRTENPNKMSRDTINSIPIISHHLPSSPPPKFPRFPTRALSKSNFKPLIVLAKWTIFCRNSGSVSQVQNNLL